MPWATAWQRWWPGGSAAASLLLVEGPLMIPEQSKDRSPWSLDLPLVLRPLSLPSPLSGHPGLSLMLALQWTHCHTHGHQVHPPPVAMESPSSQPCSRHPLTHLPAFTSLSYVSAWTTAVSKTVYSCRSRPDHQPSMPDSRWVCPTSQQLLTVACIILISQVCFLFFIRLTANICTVRVTSPLHTATISSSCL